MIEKLSDEELKQSILGLRVRERETEISFLYHLIEIERRELHLEWGYASLFSYLIHELGYSEGNASRRVRVSRALKTHPEIEVVLRSGQSNLTNLSYIAKYLDTHKNEILAFIPGKPLGDIQEWIAGLGSKKVVVREHVKPIVEKRTVSKSPEGDLFSTTIPSIQLCNHNGSEVRFEVRCAVSKELKTKLDRVKVLMSHSNGHSLENVLDVVLSEYIERHDKKEKVKRARSSKPQSRNTRYIPAATKYEVFSRANYCCEYESEDGKCCGSQYKLEIDHIKPVANGGSNEASNLRVLCREHNMFYARKAFGKEFMNEKIEEAKRF